jgi:hypothetical protein
MKDRASAAFANGPNTFRPSDESPLTNGRASATFRRTAPFSDPYLEAIECVRPLLLF